MKYGNNPYVLTHRDGDPAARARRIATARLIQDVRRTIGQVRSDEFRFGLFLILSSVTISVVTAMAL